jgi:predicted nucleotide-binding protein (sugar kinase/HSP70/actin superfamily)
MENPKYSDLPEASHEAVHAARDHAQKVEMARQMQTTEAAEAAAFAVSENIGDILQSRIEHVLAKGTEQEKSIILARVPYICQDIKNINKSLDKIVEMIQKNRTDHEADEKKTMEINDKKYVNQDQFSPFKWALVTIATVVITTLAGAILAQVIIK